jgi:hypothetical protein
MLLKESVGVGHMLSQKLTSEYKVLSWAKKQYIYHFTIFVVQDFWKL